jgi:predicted amidohydrolase
VEFDDGTKKVGLLICRDVRDKKDDKWSSFYEKGDADIVAMSANWGDGGFPAVSWMEFAKDNKVALIVANRYGKEIPNDFGEGGICVVEPSGKVHCDGIVWNQPCIVYADL